jgi:hypothetical protein
MPTGYEAETYRAIISIAKSLDILASEMKRFNDKLDKWTYHDALCIMDVTKP